MSEVINLNDTNPTAPTGSQNVKWQKGATTGTDPTTGLPIYPASAYVPLQISGVGLTIDGGASTPSVPIVRNIQVPYAGTIIGWSITNCDTAGSITCEVDKKSSSAPPAAPSVPSTSTDKISASAPISMISAQSASGGSSAISTWTTLAVAQWDVIQFNVTAMSGITRANIALIIQRG